jgi:hypothetical protein
MASVSMPMAKVRIGLVSSFVAMAQTSEESSPPESRKPTGASASRRLPRRDQLLADVPADGLQVVRSMADRLPRA